MGVDMGHFGGHEGERNDGEAEPATGIPGIVEIGARVSGDEPGAVEAGLGEASELHGVCGGRSEY